MENKVFRIDKNTYSSNEPYPEIRVLAPNQYYADLLMDDYAGVVSEFTAINQYIYHMLELSPSDSDLERIYEGISIVEMKHLEILGKLIRLLGENPIYKGTFSTEGNLWNGYFVYYGNNFSERVYADLNSEYKAISNYKNDISKIQDTYIQAILKRIILDEEVHVKIFIDIINKYCSKNEK